MSYNFVINTFGLKKEEENITIKYNGQERGKEILNSIISVTNNNLVLEILSPNLLLKEEIKLSKDFINYIAIDFNPENEKKYNLEIIIKDELYGSDNTDILIAKQNEKINFSLEYNDLKISRIVLLNSSLNFQLFLLSKKDLELSNKVSELSNKDYLIKNLYDELNNISPEKAKQFELDEKKNQKSKIFMNKKRNTNNNIFSIYKSPKKQQKEKINNNTNTKDENSVNNDTSTGEDKSPFKNNVGKEISFKVNEDLLEGNKLRFCIHNFVNKPIMTIHDMTNKIQDFKFTKIDETQLNNLYEEISEKVNNVIENINNINSLELIDLSNIKYTYSSDILIYIYNKKYLNEQDYFLYIDYCYKYIASTIKEIITDFIKKFTKNYINPQESAINFAKDIIIKTLKRFDYFHEYVKYFKNEENNVENLNFQNEKNSFKDIIGYLSIILTILFSSPFIETNKKIELFYLDESETNIYNRAKKFMFNIIDNLKPSSIFNKGLIKTTSRIKCDLNEENKIIYNNNDKQEIFILELKNLTELKEEIKTYFPKRIIRFVDRKSIASAFFDMISGDIIINESIYTQIDNNFLDDNDDLIYNSLEQYIKGNIDYTNIESKKKCDLFMYRAFWRLSHESFGHKPISIINKGSFDTPKKTLLTDSFQDTSDGGEIIEYYVINNNKDKFNYLKHGLFDIESLLDLNLYIGDSFDLFWYRFNEIKKTEINPDAEINNEKSNIYNLIIDLFHSKNISKNEKINCDFNLMNETIFNNNKFRFKRRCKI